MKEKILQFLGKARVVFGPKNSKKDRAGDLKRSGKLGGRLIIMQATTTLL
ncbi:MAG: hypothetical protein ABIB61_00640 [Candidatus Shapirobacteria bacterium]